MKHCPHNWTRLFHLPTAANSRELQVDALLLSVNRTREDSRICTLCGVHGYQTRGYARGGGQPVRVFRAGYGAEVVEQAEEWNRRVLADLEEEGVTA